MRLKAKIYSRFEFQQKFFRFLLADRVMINKDNVVLITGKRGDGKTSLALKLLLGFNDMESFSEYYNEEVNKGKEEEEKERYDLKGFSPFKMEEHLAFTRKKLHDLCRNVRKGFIQSDEAIVSVARRNSMTKANKVLHEIITINRKNLNTLLFCLPTIEDFDISILQYVTHWIHIDDRGLGVILLPEAKSLFGRKTWDIDKMKKIYDKFLEDNPTANSIPYWLFDNFRGYIRWKALGSNIEKKYLKIAHEEKNKDTEEEKTSTKESSKRGLPPEKEFIIKEIAEQLIKRKIVDPADYYSYCAKTDFKKDKLNKEVNEILASMGDGRTVSRILKDNKVKEEEENAKLLKERRILY